MTGGGRKSFSALQSKRWGVLVRVDRSRGEIIKVNISIMHACEKRLLTMLQTMVVFTFTRNNVYHVAFGYQNRPPQPRSPACETAWSCDKHEKTPPFEYFKNHFHIIFELKLSKSYSLNIEIHLHINNFLNNITVGRNK